MNGPQLVTVFMLGLLLVITGTAKLTKEYQVQQRLKIHGAPADNKSMRANAPETWKDWFTDKLSYSTSVQGNKSTETGMVLGLRCGPEAYDESALFHEMAHFVEIDDARAWCSGWGLIVPSVEVLGQEIFEMTTCQDVLREIEVCAIQLCLSQHFGGSLTEMEDTVKSFRFLGGHVYAFAYFGVEGYNDSNLHTVLWAKVQETSAKLDVQSIWAEWCRKLKFGPIPADN